MKLRSCLLPSNADDDPLPAVAGRRGEHDMTYRQKPSIFQLGKVHENGP
ncbi:MAG: hypothetical protein JWR28_1052, partial [Modestobacter sp.]|nr:hypothetical protein [Modestobacter sp.]